MQQIAPKSMIQLHPSLDQPLDTQRLLAAHKSSRTALRVTSRAPARRRLGRLSLGHPLGVAGGVTAHPV